MQVGVRGQESYKEILKGSCCAFANKIEGIQTD